ncbi:NrfD/PsrC family molybdoenzyme membrane anchor subunit [Haloactinomyces albus]|uniref:DMSO reductase anchor subunit n=1 Tax=Haloactinomyces albus TaxID=1352928 RepID=A0AAE3Z8H5_9ACTN|nr:NrfD/PsrC family molybdoenzyme membrane anchor subunit [Haloactinomyces albus]MDR7300273.1 DMSO reductase anchor subunit [Haloactinomyces albus]
MSESEVTKQGRRGARPDREALIGVAAGRKQGEQPPEGDTEFTSYYGRPVINGPVWESPDIPGYLFLGGLAGAASLLAPGADLTGRPALARVAKAGAFGGAALSLAALVHDLGKPGRFLNMLRVFKVTSPMSVGSWLLAGFTPLAGIATASAWTGRVPRCGAAATAGAAALGPAVAAYTAALVSDTAVPAWHDGYREMPFMFVGSGATAAGGLGLLAAPAAQAAPARNMAAFGVAVELVSAQWMERRLGMVAEPYSSGRSGRYMRAGKVLSVVGFAGALLGRGSRIANALSGATLLAASAATRWGVFHAGTASADDPKYTVVPQRARLRRGEPVRSEGADHV